MIHKLMATGYCATRLPGALSYMREAGRLYHGSREAMMAYQEEKYRRLVEYAYRHVPYYRRVFDGIGLFEGGRLREDRLGDIPILTKDILRQEQENMYSDEMRSRRPYSAATSGSTGIPLTIWYDRHYMARNRADKFFMGQLNGRKLGEPELKMWFRDFDLYQKNGKDKDRFYNFFTNRTFRLASVINEEALKGYIDAINQVKPVQIWSNPAPIFEVSKYVVSQGIPVHRPRSIILTSNPLYDEMRQVMQRAFPGTWIVDQYGGTEFGVVACGIREDKNLRIFEHSARVEVLDDAGRLLPHGTGDIVITGLNNYSMPLIRYRMGDMVNVLPYGDEKEGSFGSISQVMGRRLSMLRRRDGTSVTGLHLRDLLTKRWIKTFQLIQHSYDNLEALVVLEGTPLEHREGLDQIAAQIREVMGVECRFTFCDSIPSEKTGKFYYVRSELE